MQVPTARGGDATLLVRVTGVKSEAWLCTLPAAAC